VITMHNERARTGAVAVAEDMTDAQV